MNRVFFASLTILCLLSVSSMAGLIQVVKADSGTITINADGSITLSTAPITTVDNITYTFTANIINESIVVQRDNIVLDGAGFTIQGDGTGNGIDLSNGNNVTIENTNIENFQYGTYLENSSNNTISENNITENTYDGIYLYSSSNNSLSGNNITGNNIVGNSTGIVLESSSNNNNVNGNSVTSNRVGILFDSSSNNRLSGNNITNNYDGMYLYSSSNNSLSGNNITANGFEGIYLGSSSNNTIYHNNFINNTSQVYSSNSTNVWDDGSVGNYWSDYNGTDTFSCTYQNVSGSDGIGDIPYTIDVNNIDHYPLMGHFESFNVSTWSPPNYGFEEVDVISNFTVSNLGLNMWLTTPNQYLQAGQLYLSLIPAQGQNMTAGFCRMTLPNNILNASNYTVLIDTYILPMTPIVNKVATSNGTHTTLYFTFNTSAIEEIIILPEFPSFLILPLMMMATLFAVIIYKKKGAKQAKGRQNQEKTQQPTILLRAAMNYGQNTAILVARDSFKLSLQTFLAYYYFASKN